MLCPSCGRDNPSEAQFCNECGANLDTPVAITPTTSEDSSNLTSGTFVGRQQEMADLKAALEDTMAGRGRLLMLAGEPGIGKTRTAQELASHAETLGTQVLWGRCYEEQGAPPYWLWAQPIRSYVHKQDQSQLRSEMGPGAADIAEIAPELREKLPDLEPAPSLEAEQARFRLFDSITTFFKNAAQSQPLMLALDDLHWADRSSLLLLEFLAREIQSSPLLILGTYRDVEVSRRHPLSAALGSLMREQHF
ncbi:MAG: AAA family ATPase, partial [Stenotrophomonas maltophilia]